MGSDKNDQKVEIFEAQIVESANIVPSGPAPAALASLESTAKRNTAVFLAILALGSWAIYAIFFKVPLPDHYGVFATAPGHISEISKEIIRNDLTANVEFVVFDKSVSLGNKDFTLRWQNKDGVRNVEIQTQPVRGESDMLRFVAMGGLKPGVYYLQAMGKNFMFWIARTSYIEQRIAELRDACNEKKWDQAFAIANTLHALPGLAPENVQLTAALSTEINASIVKAAKEASASQRWAEAAQHAQFILRRKPDDIEIKNLLQASLYHEAMNNARDMATKQNWRKAVAEAQTALDYVPGESEALKFIAATAHSQVSIALSSKDYASALKTAEWLTTPEIKKQISDEIFASASAAALEAQSSGRWDEAQSSAEAAMQIKDDGGAMRQLADRAKRSAARSHMLVAIEQQNWDGAIAFVRKFGNSSGAEELHQEIFSVSSAQAKKYFDAKQWSDASKLASVALQIRASDAEMRDMAQSAKFNELASKARNAAYSKNWSNALLFAQTALALKRDEELSASAAKWTLEKNALEAEISLAAAKSAFDKSNWTDAIHEAKKAENDSVFGTEAKRLIGLASFNSNIGTARAAIAKNAYGEALDVLEGLIRAGADDHTEVREYYDQAWAGIKNDVKYFGNRYRPLLSFRSKQYNAFEEMTEDESGQFMLLYHMPDTQAQIIDRQHNTLQTVQWQNMNPATFYQSFLELKIDGSIAVRSGISSYFSSQNTVIPLGFRWYPSASLALNFVNDSLLEVRAKNSRLERLLFARAASDSDKNVVFRYASVSSDGKRVLASRSFDPNVLILDSTSGADLKTLSFKGRVEFLSSSFDNKLLLLKSDGGGFFSNSKYKLYDLENNIMIKEFENVRYMDMACKSKMGASTNDSEEVTITDLSNMQQIAKLKCKFQVSRVSFSQDEKSLIVSGGNGNIQVWGIDYRTCEDFRNIPKLEKAELELSRVDFQTILERKTTLKPSTVRENQAEPQEFRDKAAQLELDGNRLTWRKNDAVQAYELSPNFKTELLQASPVVTLKWISIWDASSGYSPDSQSPTLGAFRTNGKTHLRLNITDKRGSNSVIDFPISGR